MKHLAALLGWLLLAAPALALEPMEVPLVDNVAVIERNTLYDGEANVIFEQVIFWSYYPLADLHVVAWRLRKADYPPISTTSHGYVWRWWDGDNLREVHAPQYYETHSQTDHEMEDRKHLDPSDRRGLTKPFTESTSGASEGDLAP